MLRALCRGQQGGSGSDGQNYIAVGVREKIMCVLFRTVTGNSRYHKDIGGDTLCTMAVKYWWDRAYLSVFNHSNIQGNCHNMVFIWSAVERSVRDLRAIDWND